MRAGLAALNGGGAGGPPCRRRQRQPEPAHHPRQGGHLLRSSPRLRGRCGIQPSTTPSLIRPQSSSRRASDGASSAGACPGSSRLGAGGACTSRARQSRSSVGRNLSRRANNQGRCSMRHNVRVLQHQCGRRRRESCRHRMPRRLQQPQPRRQPCRPCLTFFSVETSPARAAERQEQQRMEQQCGSRQGMHQGSEHWHQHSRLLLCCQLPLQHGLWQPCLGQPLQHRSRSVGMPVRHACHSVVMPLCQAAKRDGSLARLRVRACAAGWLRCRRCRSGGRRSGRGGRWPRLRRTGRKHRKKQDLTN